MLWSSIHAVDHDPAQRSVIASGSTDAFTNSFAPAQPDTEIVTTTTRAPIAEVSSTLLSEYLSDGQMWDIRLITRPALGDEPALERRANAFNYALRFVDDVEFERPSIQIRIGESTAQDILIEWLGPDTFRPTQVLSRQYNTLHEPPTRIFSPKWFYPGENHLILFPAAGPNVSQSKLTVETFVGGTVKVSYDEQSDVLTLQRGPIVFSATPGELLPFWQNQ